MRPGAFGLVDERRDPASVKARVLDRPRLVQTRGVSGATDLGDGRPTLVLDLVALAARMQVPLAPGSGGPGGNGA